MSDLTTLDNERRTILLAEVAGLLHNLGKLYELFILAHSVEERQKPDGQRLQFDLEQVVNPRDAVDIELGSAQIEHLQGIDLVQQLLGFDCWQEKAEVAAALAGAFQRVLNQQPQHMWPTKPDRILRRLLEAADKTGGEHLSTAREVARALYGAMALAELHQTTQDPGYQAAYKTLDDSHTSRSDFLLQTQLCLHKEQYAVGELVLLMWAKYHHHVNPADNPTDWRDAIGHWLGKETHLLRYLQTAHGAVSGAEKANVPNRHQSIQDTRIASVFGHEPDEWKVPKSSLDSTRGQLLDDLIGLWAELSAHVNDPVPLRKWYCRVENLAEKTLRQGLGDTRRPINEITLWDYASGIAALFKASVARVLLDGYWTAPLCLQWRLLHLSFDGLGFLGRAHHVSDLLGRRAALDRALDAAQAMLETKFPVGNQVYHDEHGSIFVVADRPDLLHLSDADGTTLEQHVRAAFDQAGLHGELRPDIALSQPYPGQDLPLYQVIRGRAGLQQPDSTAAQRWWPAPGQPAPEICTVCGLRPVGYPPHGGEDGVDLANWATAAKATGRKLCRICLDRRGRRAQDWARNRKAEGEEPGPFHRTIWINEVADTNGRAALVVGHFDLRGWLDGRLIATLRKNASFARIRRCWDTTQQFWEAVQTETIPTAVGQVAWRLGIEVSNADDVDADLGDFHAYEWPLGHGVTLSVVWDPERRCFIAADNLAYLAGPGQLGRLKRPTVDQLRVLYTVNGLIRERGSVTVEEPSGYGQPRRTPTWAENPVPRLLEDSTYVPTIPLLTAPATFMTLVPADKSLSVIEAIRDKYATEMGQVRDRLPLHLGLVVFPRATPLRAVLDAGRALLRVASHERWEPWTVGALDPDPWDEANPPADGRRTVAFDNGVTWHVPLLMGDGETPDQWYAHCLEVDPRSLTEITLDQHLVHASQLQTGDIVWVRPSTFDYVFLDMTGRRFEIAYDADGRRFGQPGRPFDLEAVRDFPAVWQMLTGEADHPRLKRSQLHALLELARTKGGDWGSANGAAVNHLLRDALLRAAWPGGWKAVPGGDRSRLLAAVEAGWLPDLLDFYLSVLKMEPTEEEVD